MFGRVEMLKYKHVWLWLGWYDTAKFWLELWQSEGRLYFITVKKQQIKAMSFLKLRLLIHKGNYLVTVAELHMRTEHETC